MSLVADNKSSGTSYPPVEAGTHHAICYSVVDLGIQTSTWEGKEKKLRQGLIVWELPAVRIDLEKDGKPVNLPRAISRRYTLSMHEKSNLSKLLVGWLGRPISDEDRAGYDIRKLAGANCLLSVVHYENRSGDIKAKVAGAAKLMAGMEEKKPENPIVIYDMGTDGWNFPETMPDWVVSVIKESDEWLASQGELPPDEPSEDVDDDIPF